MYKKSDMIEGLRLLPSIADPMKIVPSCDDSAIRLSSLARIYAALYGLTARNALDPVLGAREEYARKADYLFRVVRQKINLAEDRRTESRLICLLYFLAESTSFGCDLRKIYTCEEAAAALLREYEKSGESDDSVQTGMYRCLIYCLGAEKSASERLRNGIGQWAAALSEVGRWERLPDDVSLERIEVMDQCAHMFPDGKFGESVCRAYAYYRYMLERKSSSDDTALRLRLLGQLYDTTIRGLSFRPDERLAAAIADELLRNCAQWPEASDERLMCLSYGIAERCRMIAQTMQREADEYLSITYH